LKSKKTLGEQKFIGQCMRAILRNKTDLTHWLFIVNGVKIYYSHKDPEAAEKHPIFSNAICVCVVDGEFIKDWHDKSMSKLNPRQFIKEGLKGLLKHSESLAKVIYSPAASKMTPEEILDQLTYDGLGSEEKEEYQKKMLESLKS
jgi:hypothetical protein